MTELLQDDEYDRRFAGVAKIYGDDSFNHYEKSHVMVIGIGGVGSWAVEALARTGIGELTLVDMDVVAASNINRQLPAMTSTLGHEKIEVMAERCRSINPRIKINLIDDYLTHENIKEILENAPDLILDCIDDVKAKLALMLHCRFNKIPLIVSGGAGGKLDPLKIRVADLSKTEQDPMLAKLRTHYLIHQIELLESAQLNISVKPTNYFFQKLFRLTISFRQNNSLLIISIN